jgi:hypothetical protein
MNGWRPRTPSRELKTPYVGTEVQIYLKDAVDVEFVTA